MPSIVNVSASWYEIDDDELATDQTDDEVPDAISFMSMVFIGKSYFILRFFLGELQKKYLLKKFFRTRRVQKRKKFKLSPFKPFFLQFFN